jgi:hypothetical protein
MFSLLVIHAGNVMGPFLFNVETRAHEELENFLDEHIEKRCPHLCLPDGTRSFKIQRMGTREAAIRWGQLSWRLEEIGHNQSITTTTTDRRIIDDEVGDEDEPVPVTVMVAVDDRGEARVAIRVDGPAPHAQMIRFTVGKDWPQLPGDQWSWMHFDYTTMTDEPAQTPLDYHTCTFASGWTITCLVETDWFSTGDSFEADHPELGHLEGSYADDVWAESRHALEHFVRHHPPIHHQE